MKTNEKKEYYGKKNKEAQKKRCTVDAPNEESKKAESS